MTVELDEVIADEGTIVLFAGTDPETGLSTMVAVDHRIAQPIADAIARGERPMVEPEPWQLIG